LANGYPQAPEAFPMFHTRGSFWLVYITLWTMAAMLLACQGYVGKIIYPEGPPVIQSSRLIAARPSTGANVKEISQRRPFSYYLLREAEVWYTRAALSPVALWIALRFRIRSKRWLRMLFVHLFTSTALSTAAVLIVSILRHWSEPDHLPFGSEVRRTISIHTATNFLVYWVLVGLVHVWHFYSDARQEELRSTRLREELAQARLTVLKAQLHPHFLFNALHSVAALLYEDPAAAEDLLLRLSLLLRTFLEDTHSQEISLRKELAILDWHLGIERIRFGDRLITNSDIETEALDCAVPHLILQTLVENAIRHGIGIHPGADEVNVQVRKIGNALQLEVTNSNSVLLLSSEEALRHGIGLSNIQSRLRELYKDQFSLALTSLVPRGVAVRVVLPFRKLTEETASAMGYTS